MKLTRRDIKIILETGNYDRGYPPDYVNMVLDAHSAGLTDDEILKVVNEKLKKVVISVSMSGDLLMEIDKKIAQYNKTKNVKLNRSQFICRMLKETRFLL
jgi:hypothetical protein